MLLPEEQHREEPIDPDMSAASLIGTKCDGTDVVLRIANVDRQRLSSPFSVASVGPPDFAAGDWTVPVANVSDRKNNWLKDFRITDFPLLLKKYPAVARCAFWEGGLDLAVKASAPATAPRRNGTSTLLWDSGTGRRRSQSWRMKPYQAADGDLRSVGITEVGGINIRAEVVPTTGQVLPNDKRSKASIEINSVMHCY